MITSSVGQLLVQQALPEDMRGQGDVVLDKKGVQKLFAELAEKHPDQYAEVAQKFMMMGSYEAQAGGHSLSLSATIPTPEVEAQLKDLRKRVADLAYSDMPDDKKEDAIKKIVMEASPVIEKNIFEGGVASHNPLAMQAKSGSRGNSSQLKQIVAGDMLVSDQNDKVIGVPILHGYAHGVEPVEYWCGAYGARRGVTSTKFATRDSGYVGKQLVMATHRLVVTEKDCGAASGIPVKANDPDNAGAVLATGVGDLAAGSVLKPEDLKSLGDKVIHVRSPITCQSKQGLCQRCVGIRERGGFSPIGDNIGIPASQAISEKLSQAGLSEKHSGGVVSGPQRKERSGFSLIDDLIQSPKSMEGAATLANLDGYVSKIEQAPQGGMYVHIGNEQHYVPPELDLSVVSGDYVEAGDALSQGVANPAELVRHKGIGEGRRKYTEMLYKALTDSGMRPHRRNVEVMARATINHVKILDLDNHTGHLPDDIVPYDALAATYQPREGSKELAPGRALNHYLEKPALHYSIGTRITSRVAKNLEEGGIKDVTVHPENAPFVPHMVRGMEAGLRDPNPITRLGGSQLEKGMLESLHRGRTAPLHSTSFIPSLAEGVDFGKRLKTEGIY